MTTTLDSYTKFKQKWYDYGQLIRIDKPIGHWLLLWPTMWGLWCVSAGAPSPKIFIVLILGVFTMRAAGCIINDITDRPFDGHVQRTKHRPLITKQITIQEAYGLTISLLFIALGLASLLDPAVWLWAIGGLILTIIYPWMKRITHVPQLVLSLTFSWGIPIASVAQLGWVPGYVWWLVAANACWVIAYDTAYAMVDRIDDLQIGVHSTAILFAKYDRFLIALCQTLTTSLLMSFGWYFQLGFYFYFALIVGVGLFIFQHHLIRTRQPKPCLTAFQHNRWYGLVIMMGFLASDLQYLAN